jgi:hypothetical protein
LEIWEDRERDGGFVIGCDLPSRALSRTLSHLMVNEPTPDGTDFTVRLAGSMFLNRYGRDVTGCRLSQLFDEDTAMRHCMDAAESLRSNRPLYLDVLLTEAGLVRSHYEIIRLPVWAPNKSARWSLAGMFYFDW